MKRDHVRFASRFMDNIEMDLKRTGMGNSVDCPHGSKQRHVVRSGEHGNQPSCSAKCGEFQDGLRNCN